MGRILTLEEAKARPLDELLHEIADGQETIRVVLEAGQEVEIKPVPKLKPLTRLQGYVPAGWKEAIYGDQ